MRFISPFSPHFDTDLARYLTDDSLNSRERIRFTAILLSSKYLVKIKELSERLDVSENSIKSWFNQYEQQGFEGLLDANMAHNQSGLSKESPEAIIAALHEAPQNLTQVVAILEDKYQIKTNKSKLRNYLKKKSIVGDEYVAP